MTLRSVSDWCEYYGAKVKDGVATLYKAVNDDFRSDYGFLVWGRPTLLRIAWCGAQILIPQHPIRRLSRGFEGSGRPQECAISRQAEGSENLPAVEVDIDGKPVATK